MSYDPLEGSSKYKVLSELGRGGMGEVFLGEHLALGSKVVIKLLHAELSSKQTLVDRMRLEAQACARLNHPNLVRVTDFDHTPTGRPYFVMEYLPGRALSDEAQARGGTVSVVDAIDYVRQALEGLSVAHAAGLVHRDIKLDNLFVCEPGTLPGAKSVVKILDFGVAKVVDAGTDEAPAPLMVPTGTGVVVGTPRFFAPEQARGMKLDHRADIYAMGLVMYSLVAGRGPFDEATTITEMAKAHVLTQPKPPSFFAKQAIPHALDQIVLKAVAKLPDHRYQSAADMSAELAGVDTSAQAAAAASTAYQQPAVVHAPQPQAGAYVTGSEAPTHKQQQHAAPATGPLPQGYPQAHAQAQQTPPPSQTGAHQPQAVAAPPMRAPMQSQTMAESAKRYSVAFLSLVMVVCCMVGVVIALAAQRL
jgi:serine/threonine protein kinase